MCNFQYVLSVDFNSIGVLGLLLLDFFIPQFSLIDDGVVASESEKFI